MLRAATFVGIACAGCTARDVATSVAEAPARAPVIQHVARAPQLLDRLRNPEPAVRDAALDELFAQARAHAIAPADGVKLVRATATLPYGDDAETAARILDALASDPRREYVQPLASAAPRLDDAARHSALHLFAAIDDPAAATEYVALVGQHVDHLAAPGQPIELAEPPALASCGAHTLATAPQLRAAYRPYRDWLAAHQHGDFWSDDYAKHRRAATLLLQAFACLPDTDDLLADALAFKDPALVESAAISLVDHGRPVAPEALEVVAKSPETRAALADALAVRHRGDLLPRAYASVRQISESRLVAWLAEPNELGRPPDQIEYVRGDGVAALYRFKMQPPHWAAGDGWLVGIYGAHGAYSELDREAARLPEEHLAVLRAHQQQAHN